MYATQRLMMIHPCAKCGKPMSNQKKLLAGHESVQTDGQTDGQDSVIPIYPLNFVRGGIKIAKLYFMYTKYVFFMFTNKVGSPN